MMNHDLIQEDSRIPLHWNMHCLADFVLQSQLLQLPPSNDTLNPYFGSYGAMTKSARSAFFAFPSIAKSLNRKAMIAVSEWIGSLIRFPNEGDELGISKRRQESQEKDMIISKNPLHE